MYANNAIHENLPLAAPVKALNAQLNGGVMPAQISEQPHQLSCGGCGDSNPHHSKPITIPLTDDYLPNFTLVDSMLKLDGQPITPMLLIEIDRANARRYRQLAVEREQQRRARRKKVVPVDKEDATESNDTDPAKDSTIMRVPAFLEHHRNGVGEDGSLHTPTSIVYFQRNDSPLKSLRQPAAAEASGPAATTTSSNVITLNRNDADFEAKRAEIEEILFGPPLPSVQRPQRNFAAGDENNSKTHLSEFRLSQHAAAAPATISLPTFVSPQKFQSLVASSRYVFMPPSLSADTNAEKQRSGLPGYDHHCAAAQSAGNYFIASMQSEKKNYTQSSTVNPALHATAVADDRDKLNLDEDIIADADAESISTTTTRKSSKSNSSSGTSGTIATLYAAAAAKNNNNCGAAVAAVIDDNISRITTVLDTSCATNQHNYALPEIVPDNNATPDTELQYSNHYHQFVVRHRSDIKSEEGSCNGHISSTAADAPAVAESDHDEYNDNDNNYYEIASNLSAKTTHSSVADSSTSSVTTTTTTKPTAKNADHVLLPTQGSHVVAVIAPTPPSRKSSSSASTTNFATPTPPLNQRRTRGGHCDSDLLLAFDDENFNSAGRITGAAAARDYAVTSSSNNNSVLSSLSISVSNGNSSTSSSGGRQTAADNNICSTPSSATMRPALSDVECALQGFLVANNGVRRPSALSSSTNTPVPSTPTTTSTLVNNVWTPGAALSTSSSLHSALNTRRQLIMKTHKKNFDRATAAARGFLLRRYLQTEKLQHLIHAIRDVEDEAVKLMKEKQEQPPAAGAAAAAALLTPEEVDLGRMMLRQLRADRLRLHELLFETTCSERLQLIAYDREQRRRQRNNTTRQQQQQQQQQHSSRQNSVVSAASTATGDKSSGTVAAAATVRNGTLHNMPSSKNAKNFKNSKFKAVAASAKTNSSLQTATNSSKKKITSASSTSTTSSTSNNNNRRSASIKLKTSSTADATS